MSGGPGTGDPAAARAALVTRLRRQGIADERVLAAVAAVPREAFVPPGDEHLAYDDVALPLERGQSISSPWIVAATVAALGVGPDARVLEVGTGSGYAAAVLARCAGEVVTVERDAELARRARDRLAALAPSVRVLTGDGLDAAAGLAPFDGIVVTAMARDRVPPELVDQLAPRGTLVCPVGAGRRGRLVRHRCGEVTDLGGVAFVPLVRGTRE